MNFKKMTIHIEVKGKVKWATLQVHCYLKIKLVLSLELTRYRSNPEVAHFKPGIISADCVEQP